MSDVLTMTEIEERYPDQWVLIDEPELNEHQEVLRGTLIAASDNPDELERECRRRRLRFTALFYIGEPEPDLGFAL